MWVQVANGAISEGDAIGALQSLQKAETFKKNLPEIHHTRALAFHMKKDDETALAEARIAVKLEPKFSDANNTLGKLLVDKGKYDEAIPYLTAAATDPLYREAYKPHTNLGIIHYRRGKYDLARTHFTKAIDASPVQSCIAFYYRGHLGLRESRVREAIRDYEQATKKLCADFADAHFALGIALERSGQFDRARKKFVEIQQRYPETRIADQAVNRLRQLP